VVFRDPLRRDLELIVVAEHVASGASAFSIGRCGAKELGEVGRGDDVS
jgi:hypothetical protein